LKVLDGDPMLRDEDISAALPVQASISRDFIAVVNEVSGRNLNWMLTSSSSAIRC
jgi:hypothetical protein